MSDQRPDTAHAVSPDSGVHWAEPGAWPVAPGVHRIPLPLPMDGLKAVNVYALETDDGLTLVDAGWAVEASRDRAGEVALRRWVRASATSAGSWSPTCTVTTTRRRSRSGARSGSHVSLGAGEQGQPGRDPGGWLAGPTRSRCSAAPGRRAHRPRSGSSFGGVETPDLALWADPDSWLEGDHTLTVGARTPRRHPHAGPHAGPLRVRRHRRRAAVRRRPRAADDHPVDRVRAGTRRRSRSATSWRPWPRCGRCPTCGCCPPTARSRPPPTPASTSSLAHHERTAGAVPGRRRRQARATAYDVAGELPWTRHERRLRRARRVQRRHGDHGDPGTPGAARAPAAS